MIVDDNETIVELISDILKMEGFETVECTSGYQCLERLEDSVDLIMLDITMPGIDGWEVVKRIRAMEPLPRVKILLFSALQESDVPVDPPDGLVVGYMKKPLKPDTMIRRINEAIGGQG